MTKKKFVSLALTCLSTILLFSGGIQKTLAAGASAWVTYAVSNAYCKEVPYGAYGTKPYTFQDYYQRKTIVNNGGKVTYKYRVQTKSLGAGCK